MKKEFDWVLRDEIIRGYLEVHPDPDDGQVDELVELLIREGLYRHRTVRSRCNIRMMVWNQIDARQRHAGGVT